MFIESNENLLNLIIIIEKIQYTERYGGKSILTIAFNDQN